MTQRQHIQRSRTMDTTVVLLALLCCSLSGVQGEGDMEDVTIRNDITHKQTQGERSQNTCQPDIHAVLREMSATMAEQRVEMAYLKRENEEQRVEMAHLKRENEAQALQLRALEEQKIQVDRLKKELEVRQVAFSASLLASGVGTLGPFKTDTNLVYRHVITNIGNAYNPITGVFTAPVRGAYQFQLYVGAFGDSSASGAFLYKNEQRVFTAYELQASGYGTSANGASLLLEEGDVVFIKLCPNARMHDNENHHSTFSGNLLFTM